MKIAIGCDHAGLNAKNELINFLRNNNYEVVDFGTYTDESCDYPVFGKAVGNAVKNKEADFGVVICSTGEGIMMSVNKIPGIRCGLGYADDASRLMREHNNAQVISFGANLMDVEDIKRRTLIFLNTPFSNGERHIRRIDLIEK